MVLFAGKLYKRVSLFTLSLVLAISSLSVAAPLYFNQVAHAADPQILYVSETGDDTGDCISFSAPCRTIGSAINKASNSDTINVAAGTYAEHIIINKSLTINGANAGVAGNATRVLESIVDGGGTSGAVVTITATSSVILNGFTIRNSGANIATDAGIGLVGVSGVTVEDNIISNNVTGIAVMSSSVNIINNNEIKNSARYGIVLEEYPGDPDVFSTSNTISGNTMTANARDGIYVGKDCNSNIITGNTISGAAGTTEDSSFEANGIYFWKSAGNTVTNNTISSNVAFGIEMYGSSNNSITGNTVTGNNDGFHIRNIAEATGYSIKNNNISGNKIYDNTHVNLYASPNFPFDIKNNWWGSADRATIVSKLASWVSDDPDLADSVTPGTTVFLDFNPWYNTDAKTTKTYQVGVGETYTTIQSAITAASAGDTINVAAGIYSEQVIINKNLTLQGSGRDSTKILSPASLTETGTGKKGILAVISPDSANPITVDISGITVDGQNQPINNLVGVHFFAANGSLSNSRVTGMRDLTLGGQNRWGVFTNHAYDTLVSTHVTINNNIIDNYQKAGIVASEWGSTMTATGNTVTGAGPTTVIAQNGIESNYGASATISGNNIVSGHNYTGLIDDYAAGILVVGNHLTGDSAQPSTSISNNTVSDNEVGVAISTDATYGYGDVLATINNNSITSNITGVKNDNLSGTLDATNNNWGTTVLDEIETLIDHNCTNSPYVHGSCNAEDNATFGFVKYAEITTPTNEGWNEASQSVNPNDVSLDLVCTLGGVYTNENSVAQNWSAVNGSNIKYQREVTFPNGTTQLFNPSDGNNYTPFGSFGAGDEGQWGTRVRAYVDANGNNIIDSGEETSGWSNECNITFDKTASVIGAHDDIIAEATSTSGAVVTYTVPTATDNVDATVIVTCSPVSGSTFAFGTTPVTCNATDAAGNSATPTTFNVIVQYTSPLVSGFTSPESSVRENNYGDIAAQISVPIVASNVRFTITGVDLVFNEVVTDSDHTFNSYNNDIYKISGAAAGSQWWRVNKNLSGGKYNITGEFEINNVWYPISGSAFVYSINTPWFSYVTPSTTGLFFRPTDMFARIKIDDQYNQTNSVSFEIFNSNTNAQIGGAYTVLRANCDLHSAGEYIVCDLMRDYTGVKPSLTAGTYYLKTQSSGLSGSGIRYQNTQSLNFNIDGTRPTLSDLEIDNSRPIYKAELVVSVLASDDNGIANVEFYITSPRVSDNVCDGNGTKIDSIVKTALDGDGRYRATFDTSSYNGQLCVNAIAADVSNSHSDTQKVSALFDNIAPVISLDGITPDIEVGGSYVELGATAVDALDGSFAATPSGSVNTTVVDSYIITYNATDVAGNPAAPITRTVNVVDTIDPVITLLGITPAADVEVGSSYTDAGATASDNFYGDLTSSITTVNPVDANAVGVYTVTYNVTDANGNAADQVARTVNVVDTTAPNLTINSYGQDANVIKPNITATDDSTPLIYAWTTTVPDTDVTISNIQIAKPTFTVHKDGTYSFNLTTTDSAGNSTTKIFTFTYTTPVVPATTTSFSNVVTAGTSAGGAATEPAELADNSQGVVQGASTTTPSELSSSKVDKTASILGDSTNKDNGSIWGLAWYWWLAILAAGGLIIWWIVASAIRNNDNQNS